MENQKEWFQASPVKLYHAVEMTNFIQQDCNDNTFEEKLDSEFTAMLVAL